MVEVTDEGILVGGLTLDLKGASDLRSELEAAIWEFARKSFNVS